MYTYGVLITDEVTGAGKFGLFTGGTAKQDAINLVKMNGSGQVKRTGHSYGESRSWDAPTFNVCSEPVFVLAENAITKSTVDVGLVIQVATLDHRFPTPQYGISRCVPVEMPGWVLMPQQGLPFLWHGAKIAGVSIPGRFHSVGSIPVNRGRNGRLHRIYTGA